jgi:hypothetical protein
VYTPIWPYTPSSVSNVFYCEMKFGQWQGQPGVYR